MAELLAAEVLYALASAGVSTSLAVEAAIVIGSYVVVAGTAYAIAQSMIPTPAFGSLQSETSGKITMTRDTVASRRVIYGTSKVSGPMLFASTNSSGGSNKNEFLHLVVALAGHEISDLKNIYFNDVMAFDSGSGQTATFPADKLAITYKVGATSQTAYTMTPSTEWDSDCKLNGIASIYAKLVADPAVYPNGIPNISATVVGHKLQDETGTDVDYYDNPALILRHYLLNYFGATSDEIDSGSFDVAKDACNYEPYGANTGKRYTCNYTFTLNTKPSDIIEDILKTCYGKLVYTNGKFTLKVGVYSAPTIYLNEDDLLGSINVTTKTSIANSFNSVRGLYVDGNNYTSSFQAADFVPITSSVYLAEDGGVANPIDIELSGVTDHTVARRIAKLTLLDSRQDLTVSITTKISGLQLIAGDNVYLSVERYGWVDKIFEVVELTINPDLSMNISLKETAAAIYDFPIGEDVDRDLSPNTNLPNPFVVQPPVGFTALETTVLDKDGTVFPSVSLYWSASFSGSIADIEVDFKNTSSADYSAVGTFGRTIGEFTTIDVEAGKTYDFRARNFNYLGVFSSYVSKSLKVFGDTTPPQTPSGISATGGTGSFAVNWTNAAVDTDYNFTKIWFNNVNNTSTWTFEGSVSGTTWNKTVSSGSTYYVWLQNVDTSGNMSGTSSFASAVVTSIGAGSTGPSGSAGPSGSNGVAGNIAYDIYQRNSSVPTGSYLPVGNLTPAFWSTSIPADNGNALWQSNGLISGSDGITLIGSWSTPERLTGKVSWYQTSAPTGATTSSIAQGDLWWDTDDNYKPYRFISTSNSGSWQPVDDGRINPISQSLVNFGGEYALTVTASGTPRIAGFRIINQSSASSDFTVQADTFRIYNTTNGTVSQSFFADAQGVYMPQAFIRELDAVKITAGTISAAVLLTAARLESPEITASGIMINDDNGLRYKDNNGNFIITGGSANGENNGAQIDLVGSGGAATGSKGTLVLSACNVGTTAGDGTIRFRTAATEQAILQRDGTFELNHSSTDNGFKGASIRFGTSTASTDRAISCNFAADGACLTYAGGTGVTGTLVASESHRWVDSGNNNELMALTTGGNLYVQTDVYADAFNSPSSIKYKENIQPLLKATDIINALQPKTFDWKDGSKKADVGLIAEQVAEIIPNIVSYKDGEVSGLDYAKLTPFLIAAIQQQNVLIENMRLRLGVLEKR